MERSSRQSLGHPPPHLEESRALSLFAKLLDAPDAHTAAAQTAMGSLSDPARVREALEGCEEVRVTSVATETVWGRDAADAVGFILSRTPGRMVDTVTRKVLEATLHPYETNHGVRLRAAVWLVTAEWSPGVRP
ncbi:hypothetical protein ABZV34_31775 [Streptomyces sp. NPDC005195]|uniref:hypothetical protein n=1 Tax=Streptomyces sp. NPDC005195 TaxID=3154561 RepID=UPI0033BD5650